MSLPSHVPFFVIGGKIQGYEAKGMVPRNSTQYASNFFLSQMLKGFLSTLTGLSQLSG